MSTTASKEPKVSALTIIPTLSVSTKIDLISDSISFFTRSRLPSLIPIIGEPPRTPSKSEVEILAPVAATT